MGCGDEEVAGVAVRVGCCGWGGRTLPGRPVSAPVTHHEGRAIGVAAYNAGCRCDPCRKAAREYNAARRATSADATRRAYVSASDAASAWVRKNRPDVWNELLLAARAKWGVS